MQSFSKLVLCVAFFAMATNAHLTSMNAVQDAKLQSGKLLRCWENVDSKTSGSGFTLSEPLYPFCSYMPSATSFEQFYVNGVDENSDDYTNIHNIFQDVVDGHAVLNVCLQEGFSFFGNNREADCSLRCLCKRDGCNIPKPFLTFLEFNKKAIPAIAH